MSQQLLGHLNYLGAMVLFAVGLYTMLTHGNLIKKIIGMNIMDTAVFLFIVSLGYVRGGQPPIGATGPVEGFVNPLPSALILTGIVIAVSTTAFALALAIKIHETLGTLDADEIVRRTRSG
jgi:multicomponent Na+:H+ antiporter subunit C